MTGIGQQDGVEWQDGVPVARRFDDPYYFSRLFKKIISLSPLHYRETIEERELNSRSLLTDHTLSKP